MKMGIINNFFNCITKNYFKFSGRATRREYWKFVGALLIIGIIFSVLEYFALQVNTLIYNKFQIVIKVFYLFVFLPHLTVAVRRLHDTGRSGWTLTYPAMVLVAGSLITVILKSNLLGTIVLVAYALAGIYIFALLLKEGTRGKNRYGADPYLEF